MRKIHPPHLRRTAGQKITVEQSAISVLRQAAKSLTMDGDRLYFKMLTADFLKLDIDAFDIQREVKHRYKKLVKYLKSEALSVASVGDMALRVDANGIVTTINGNTRLYLFWLILNNIDPTKFKGVHFPPVLYFTLYRIDSDEEAKKLYYSFDHRDAMENSSDKLTGVARNNGISFTSDKFQKGKYSTPLAAVSKLSGIELHKTADENADQEASLLYFMPVLNIIDGDEYLSELNNGSMGACMYSFASYLLHDIPCAVPEEVINFYRRVYIGDGDGGSIHTTTGQCAITFLLNNLHKKEYQKQGLKLHLFALNEWMNGRRIKSAKPGDDIIECYWHRRLR